MDPVRQTGLILSLGSANADFQLRVDRRPEISETLVGRDFLCAGGGKAANVAAFARKLGLGARLFAHVGDDDLAERALAPLRAVDVDLAGVAVVPGCATGVAMITVPPDGQKGIVLSPNANDDWTEHTAATVTQLIEDSPSGSVLVVDCEIPVFVVERAAEAAGRRGLSIILDPSPADRVTEPLIASARVVVPNGAEAETLTGVACRDVRSAAEAGRRLLDRGADAACVKLDEGGCVLVAGDASTHIPGAPVEVVDTTGAGDAFAGALAVACAEGHPLPEAARFAAAAAHRTVAGYGSQAALPTRDQIEEMLGTMPASESIEDSRN